MGINIKDVANKAGVSVSTVSRAFTRPELVSKATRAKVLAIAEELNFLILQGLNQVFHANGYDLSIFQIFSIEERREFFDMLPIRRNADAVIVP